MGIVDARSIPEAATLETDVCIVGAGAAGITLARELSGAAFRVALVESGGLRPEVATQELLQAETTGQATSRLDETRWSGFGGTTNVWLGACRPLDEIDFAVRDWVPHSGWPLSKQHLDPYYERAQAVCQLGNYDYDVNDWEDESTPRLPLPAARITTHMFQISPPTRFGSVYRHDVVAARNVRTYLHANVVEIETTPNGQEATGVRLATLRGTQFRLLARVVVLAAGGIEVPRLLLLSNRAQSCGLGNEHDVVGRYFSDHPRVTSGVLELVDGPRYRPLYSVHSAYRAGQLTAVEGLLALGDELTAQERLLRCAFRLPARWQSFPAYHSRGTNAMQQLVRGMRQGTPYRWRRHLMSVVGNLDAVVLTTVRRLTNGPDDGRRGLVVAAHTEQAPNPDSRVELAETRDRLGRRTVRLNWRLSELDRWTIKRGTELLAEEVARAGIGKLHTWLDRKDVTLRDGFHHMGTTRMHTSPTQGVVDPNARVHGTTNLYVAGSSIFPTGGYANPTLTVVALTIRLADHIKTLFA